MNRLRLEAKRAVAQRLAKRLAGGAAGRLDQRPLHQRGAKMGQQRGDAFRLGPSSLGCVNILPSGKGRRGLDADRMGHGAADHPEHVCNLLIQGIVRHLGEPLGRQQIGGNA
ncbi:uncharacterized protein METZ01_LOCUS338722, partial [marine metagenome]